MQASSWFDEPTGNAHSSLWKYVEELAETYMQDRLTAYELYLGMMGDTETVGVYPSRTTPSPTMAMRGNHLTLNVSRALKDTAVSKITQARPRPYFLTYGGDFDQQEQAKTLQLFADGMFDQSEAYRVGAEAFADACALGTGCIKVVEKKGKPHLERVLISNILVDETLAWGRDPLELFERREISRAALAAKFPKFKAHIKGLVGVDCLSGERTQPDMVVCYEAWRLPIGKEKGRHVIIVQGATLLDEEWEHDWFPFEFIRWSTPSVGFYGIGIPAQILGLQIEINRILRAVSKNIHMHGNPRILLEMSSKINPASITNGFGDIMKYSGTKPDLWVPAIMSPEVYQHLLRLYDKCFELTGLSQQAAFAKKEPGLVAAKAIREQSDLQADRLAPVSQEYERFYLGLTRKMIGLMEDIHDAGDSPDVSVVSDGVAKKLQWSEVRMPQDDYVIQLFPASFLARTPAGKLADVQDLMDRELIEKDQAKRLLDFPDLKDVMNENNSLAELYKKQILMIMKDGEYIAPEPFEDFALGMRMYRSALMQARIQSADDEKLELLRKWLISADAMMAEQMPPAPPPEQTPPAPMPVAA